MYVCVCVCVFVHIDVYMYTHIYLFFSFPVPEMNVFHEPSGYPKWTSGHQSAVSHQGATHAGDGNAVPGGSQVRAPGAVFGAASVEFRSPCFWGKFSRFCRFCRNLLLI